MEKDTAGKIEEAFEYVRGLTGSKPKVGLVFGSGLSGLADGIEDPISIPYEDIPHFPPATVSGHPGRLVLGRLAGLDAVAMLGRLHYYEGYAMGQVAYPIRLMGRLGAVVLVETCATGALRPGCKPGDLAIISDHVNLMGANPLQGDAGGANRFVDMAGAYSSGLSRLMLKVAAEMGLELREGVYVAVSGPSYETHSETVFLKDIGDFVGMSLVPEVIVARQLEMDVVAVAVVTNVHNGAGVSHEKVIEVARDVGGTLRGLIEVFISRLSQL